MKKILTVVLIVMVAVAFAVPAYAGGGDKAKAGFERLIKSPKQICDNVKAEWDAAEFKPLGAVGGTIKGAGMMVVDVIGGTVDILTAPFGNE